MQEVEEARIPELEPAPIAIKLGECEEEVGERRVLATKQVGEAVGQIARFHERIISRVFGA